MSRIVLFATVCGLALVATPTGAEEVKPAPAKKSDPTERLIAVLEQDVQLKEGLNVNEVPLFEVLTFLSKQHNVPFVVNEESFKRVGQPNIKDEKSTISTTQLREVTLHRFLSLTLESLGAAYLVKNGVLEIVSTRHAAAVTKSALDIQSDEDGRPRLREALVSAVIKEKPLNEAVARLAELYDLTVIVSPQAADAKMGFVTARLLNVPADKAIELLAVQCDLRVVRKGTAFLITHKDHANEMFNEKLDKERQKIEVEKLREAPARPPAPPAPPAPPEKQDK